MTPYLRKPLFDNLCYYTLQMDHGLRTPANHPMGHTVTNSVVSQAVKAIGLRQLAQQAGVEPSHLSRGLRGYRGFTLEKAASIAQAMGVSLDELWSHIRAM